MGPGINPARFSALALLCCLVWCAAATAETAHRDAPLVIGYSAQVFYNVDHRDAIQLTKVWVGMADRKIGSGEETAIVEYTTLGDMERALAKNEIDILITIPEEFVRLRTNFHLTPVLSADYGKHFYNELIMLVRDDGGITRMEQLRGKSLRIDAGQKGSVPMQWLDSYLTARTSSSTREFFGSVTECIKPSQAVMPVFFRQADACLVSRSSYETMVELNPQLGRQLRILEQSPGFLTGVISVRKGVRNPRRDAMMKAFQDMHSDSQGKQILTLFRIKRLIPFMPEHLASIEKVTREHRGTTDHGAGRKH